MRISDWSSDVCSSDLIVRAVEVLHVQRQAGVLGKGLKPLLEQLGVHGAELVAAEIHLPDEIGAVRRIERHPGQGLVHRNERLTIAPDALALAQGLGHRLADHDAAVLGGVVIVDMQMASALQLDFVRALWWSWPRQ